MKKQQTILQVYKNGIVTDFERFTQKTLNGVLTQYREIANSWHDWMWVEYETADSINIYRTPEDKKEFLIASYTPKEFFKAIGRIY